MKRDITERPNGRKRVQQSTVGESRTEQAHANEVDINAIVSRYTKSGMLPPGRSNPSYGDFTGVVDFHTAQQAVVEAREEFMKLPAQVRKYFDNDPGKLISFLENEENREEAIRLGLVEERPVAEPVGPQTADVPPVESPVEGPAA